MKREKTPLENALFTISTICPAEVMNENGEMHSATGWFCVLPLPDDITVAQRFEDLRYSPLFPTQHLSAILLAGPHRLVGYWVLREWSESDFETKRFDTLEGALGYCLELESALQNNQDIR
jgi:hypothetical protein